MTPRQSKRKFLLAILGLYGILALLFGGLGVIVWAEIGESERSVALGILMRILNVSILITLLSWVFLGVLAKYVFDTYIITPLRLAERANAIANASPQARLIEAGAPEVRAIAHAINTLAAQREALLTQMQEQIRHANAQAEAEKERLLALMSELTQSVVLVTGEGRTLLYNRAARDLLGESAAGTLGLGRSIFTLLGREHLLQAFSWLTQNRGDSSTPEQSVFRFTTPLPAPDERLVRISVALVPQPEGQKGEPGESSFVLVLDEVTQMVRQAQRREALVQALCREAEGLSEPMQAHLAELAALQSPALLENIAARDLLQAAQQQISQAGLAVTIAEDAQTARLWLQADWPALLRALLALALRLKHECQASALQIALQPAGRLAHLDLLWQGAPLSAERLAEWERTPLAQILGSEGGSQECLRDIIARHGGEAWLMQNSTPPGTGLRWLIPTERPPSVAAIKPRPQQTYDFSLLAHRGGGAAEHTPLTALSYTVFDTETTGLQPSAGDEILQIGAVRIVNGRILKSENFDQLINPRRRIEPASVAIHGITQEMVADAPDLASVLPRFHAFCADTVLVAHNAAFDLRFLKIKEASLGLRFEQPVLDTLLLAALLHPHQSSHSFEASAELLGLSISGRHMALGDAMMTAELFLRMIPLLVARGINTLGQALAASAQTNFAQLRY